MSWVADAVVSAEGLVLRARRFAAGEWPGVAIRISLYVGGLGGGCLSGVLCQLGGGCGGYGRGCGGWGGADAVEAFEDGAGGDGDGGGGDAADEFGFGADEDGAGGDDFAFGFTAEDGAGAEDFFGAEVTFAFDGDGGAGLDDSAGLVVLNADFIEAQGLAAGLAGDGNGPAGDLVGVMTVDADDPLFVFRREGGDRCVTADFHRRLPVRERGGGQDAKGMGRAPAGCRCPHECRVITLRGSEPGPGLPGRGWGR